MWASIICAVVRFRFASKPADGSLQHQPWILNISSYPNAGWQGNQSIVLGQSVGPFACPTNYLGPVAMELSDCKQSTMKHDAAANHPPILKLRLANQDLPIWMIKSGLVSLKDEPIFRLACISSHNPNCTCPCRRSAGKHGAWTP